MGATEFITAANQPIIKLIESVSNAIGTIYEPRHIRKLSDARAYEIETISSALQKSVAIPVSYNSGEISASNTDFDDFVKRAENRLAIQELRKQQNIENVIDLSMETLQNIDSCSEEPVNPDWIFRFFDCVENISDNDLQMIWSKLLAGEIKQPHSFSMRTLETLRNISKDEALVFQKLCPFIIPLNNSAFIFKDETFFDEYNIRYKDIILMEECGLMTANPNVAYNVPIGKDETALAMCDQIIMSASAKGEYMTPFSINQYPLTVAGKELYQLIAEPISESVFLSFAKIIKQKNKSLYNVYAYRIGAKKDDKYQTSGPDLLADV